MITITIEFKEAPGPAKDVFACAIDARVDRKDDTETEQGMATLFNSVIGKLMEGILRHGASGELIEGLEIDREIQAFKRRHRIL